MNLQRVFLIMPLNFNFNTHLVIHYDWLKSLFSNRMDAIEKSSSTTFICISTSLNGFSAHLKLKTLKIDIGSGVFGLTISPIIMKILHHISQISIFEMFFVIRKEFQISRK